MKCQIKKCRKEAILEVKQLNFGSAKFRFCVEHFKDLYFYVVNFDVKHSNKLLRINQVATLLQVHPETLRRWDKSGRLKAVRMGSRRDRRYKTSDVLSLI